jgi:hypothetical protein
MAIKGDVATLQIIDVLKAAPGAKLPDSIEVAGIPEDSNKRPCRGNAATTGLHYIVLLRAPAGSGPAFRLIGGSFDAVIEWNSDVEESIRQAVADPAPVPRGNAPTTVTSRTVTLVTKRFPDVSYGTLRAPEEYELRAGGTDSFMGTLIRKSDGFTIHFDIGKMAGIHINAFNKDKFALFRVHTVGNTTAYTGIERANGKQTVVTTISASAFPANFWADFTRDEDLLDFMLIVNSYTPKVPL